ncbi:MAG: ABC transporter permease subunit [Chloroflexi bacterium]|nr:ABC transporter permease subunit [Chloroflexota bacterium]
MLYAANFLGVILAVVISADTISGDIETGAIYTILTKPLRRWEVVLGKWLGLAILLGLIVIAVAGGMILVSWLISGYAPPNFGRGVGLMVLSALVLLSVSILGGTRLTTLVNGVFVLMLYGLAFIASWIEQIGSCMQSEAAVDVGILISFLMPSEAMWTRASYLMQPAFLRELGFSPFAIATAPSVAMVIYSLVYVAAIPLAAIYLFKSRDM